MSVATAIGPLVNDSVYYWVMITTWNLHVHKKCFLKFQSLQKKNKIVLKREGGYYPEV